MTFEEWWNEQDYPASCKGNCQRAFEARESELAEKDIIINFLKKELIKKTYCRQVMKKQYRELKQKYEALLHKINPVDARFANFVKDIKCKN